MTEAAAGSSSEIVQAPPQMPAHLAQKLESEQHQFEKQSVPFPLTLLQCMDYSILHCMQPLLYTKADDEAGSHPTLLSLSLSFALSSLTPSQLEESLASASERHSQLLHQKQMDSHNQVEHVRRFVSSFPSRANE